nr:DNA-directed RNA polymerase I subunit RPA49 [Cryptococcus depauperatus CBS 7841]
MASSSQLPKKSQKRKSMASGSASTMSITLEEALTGAGPVFANFPSLKPSKNTAFGIYSRDAATTFDISKQHTLVAGETEDVEFFSTNRDRGMNVEGADVQYLPAIYDPSTQTVHIHPSTPLYLLAHRVKRLRNVSLTPAPTQHAKALYKVQRNNLGEAFGTRKAKSQIKSEERNKVNADAMKDAKDHLMETIGELDEDHLEVTAPGEMIPTPNLETSDVTEVYPRESIIPSEEWQALDVGRLLEAGDDKERNSLLPWRRSSWLHYKLRNAINIKDKSYRKIQLQYILYLACLLHFLDFAPRLPKTPASELLDRFVHVPRRVLDSLITRFTEVVDKKHNVTEKMRTKLLVRICLLYLILDGYNAEVAKVAKDLKMEPTKISTLFKQLGCTLKIATPEEREAQGITLAEASSRRRAVLTAPVKFPKIKQRGPAKR